MGCGLLRRAWRGGGTAQSRGSEAGADLTVTGSTAAEPLERRIRYESFDSSLASPVLAVLNGSRRCAEQKALLVSTWMLYPPACMFPPR